MILLFVAVVFVGLLGFWWFDGYRKYGHLVKWKVPGSHFFYSLTKGTEPANNGAFVFPLSIGFCFGEMTVTAIDDQRSIIVELSCPTIFVSLGSSVFAVSYGLTHSEQQAKIQKAETLKELRMKQDARERNKSGRSTNRSNGGSTGNSGTKSKTNKSVGSKKR